MVANAETLKQRPSQITVSDSGAGFGDAAHNALVEAAAMQAVIAHFEGWIAEDVSSEKCGWDISFRRAEEEIRAEVKGGKKPSILLTRNGYATAHADERWRLAVVTMALTQPTVQVFDPPIALECAEAYVYRVDLSDSDATAI